MIPKLLTIKGLYSYQTEQTIDFTALTKSNLFGIFGNVGAGKSSILEAIMLALYGEVERMGKAGRNYNIMNLRSDDLYILFDFEIEGKLYRSKVLGSRNSKRFGDVKIKSPAFFEFIEEEFKPIDIETAEILIGLKPDDFKKTIIIPQGTFQDFLQLGDTDRARMMRELFGLERYELEPKVKFLQNENDTKAQILRGQLTQIGDINSEDIEIKKSQLHDLQIIIMKNQVEIEEKRKEENELKQLKSDFDLWQQTQKLNAELASREEHFTSLEKQMDDYESAVLNFKNPLENYNKATKDLIQNKANLNKKQGELAKNDAHLLELNELKEKMTPQYEQREKLKKQAEEARKIIDIQKTQTELIECDSRISKGFTFLNDKMLILEQEKTRASEVEKQRISLRANQPNLSILNAVKDWFTIHFNFQKEITRYENELKVLDEKIAAMHQAKSVIVWKDLPTLNMHLASEIRISDVIGEVKSKILSLKTDSEIIQHEQLHLKASEKMESLASALAEGDACPLCGATHHPSVMQISEVRSTLKALETRLAQHKKDIKTLENIENQLFTLNINFNNETEARRNVILKIADEKRLLDAHIQKFSWSSFSPTDYSAVEEALQAATDFDAQMKKLEDSLQSINRVKESTEKDIEKFRNRISELQAEKAAKESAIQILKTQIEVLDFENNISKAETELKEWSESLEKQYITIESAFQSLDKNLQKCQSEGQLLRGSIETLAQAQKELETAEMTLSSELKDLLGTSNFETIEMVKGILATNLNISVERQKLNDFKNQKLLVSARLTELNEKMQGKTYNSEYHSTLVIEIQDTERQIQTQNQLVGELKSDISDKTARFKQRKEIEKRLAECDIRAENLRILRGLFQRSGFVNYASSVFLQSIINAANERFMKLTRQQLRLEMTETNSFIVRDMLNEGKFRDVRTLSGGQTFQAALSLALALSDHIQSRNQARQNFFFLDEGFGSLGRESLQTVFDSLKDLRNEKRIVGVISHVEDMRLEIERYLEVRLSESNGSEVNMVIG